MNINLIEAIDNAKVDSEIAVAESMIMCYDKQLLLMEYESPVDIFQEGKIMDDVKEQGKGQTKAQKILTFIPRLLKAIFKALTGKLNKAGGSANKVAAISKKIPAEINKKIANAFNKGDKKALKTVLVASIAALGAGGVAIGSKAIAKKLKPEWFKKKEDNIKEKTDKLSSKKPESGLVKIGKKWTSLFEKFSKQGGISNIDIEKEADNIIKDIDKFIGYDYDNDLIDEEKDLVKELNEIAKELSGSENTETPKNTEKPAEQKVDDTQEAPNNKDPEDVDAFVDRVLTDEVKELIRLGLFEIKEDNGCLRFYLCSPDAFIRSLEGCILDIVHYERYSKTKKLLDKLKEIINGNYPSNLKEIVRILNIDMDYWKFILATDTKQAIDKQYNESKGKEFVFYGENDEEDEKLAKEYKTTLNGLYNLLLRYISNITGVVDSFVEYFLNIDKNTMKTSLLGYVRLQGNEDVTKHAKMIDSSIKGAMSKS